MSWSDGEQNIDPFGAEGVRPVRGSPLVSRLRKWTPSRIVRLSVALMLLITAADALLGPRVILIGLLMVGPCCALFSGRRSSTALVGTTAVGLALLLALPDGIWDTVAQLAFIGAVLLVAVACTWAAGILEPVINR